jgi:hypothetical protein
MSQVYRNHYRDGHGESQGYEYFSARRDAERAERKFLRDDPGGAVEREELVFPLTKGGVIDMMNQYASHADNG